MRKICCFLLIVFSLAAEEGLQVVRQANAYFEAKEFDRAYDLYKTLLQGKAAPWQKERILYNLGTILLAKGEYEQALEQYVKIPYLKKGAPYLTRALQTNLAILFYRRASIVKNRSEAFFYLRTALNHVDKAIFAECELEKIKNHPDCLIQHDLIELRGAIKNQLAIALDQYGKSRVAEAALKEGIPFLMSGINLAESHLDFLKILGGPHLLFDQYLRLFIKDLHSWDILWEALEKKLQSLSKPRAEFQKGIQLMEKGELKKSRSAFLDTESQLSSLMRNLWGNDPYKELLRNLLTTYQYAFDQIPIQAAALYPLEAKQEQIMKILKDEHISNEYLEYSDKLLQTSLKFAQAGKGTLSGYYLEDARQWIKRALRNSTRKPEDTLEDAIDDQQHALALNHLLKRMSKGEYNPASLLKGAQKFTLKTAEPFIQEVLKEEKKHWPKVCQCKPWDLAIPLFVQGEEAARLANGLLEQDSASLFAMRLQEKALEYWKKALFQMLHSEQSQKEKKQQKQKTLPSSSNAASEQTQTMNEIQRELQLMYDEDQKLKLAPKTVQKGMHPW